MEDQQVEQTGNSGRSARGFASMDRDKQRQIASKGGRAAHEKGTAHEFDSGEASQAAKKGHQRGTAHEFTSEEARIAGRKGGMARAANRNRARRADMPPPNPPAGDSLGQPMGSMASPIGGQPVSMPQSAMGAGHRNPAEDQPRQDGAPNAQRAAAQPMQPARQEERREGLPSSDFGQPHNPHNP